jgi:MGT family glycosyltransferase
MYNDEPALYDAIIDAFADTPCRVIMSLSERIDAARVPRRAPNIVIRPSMPQRDVLREVDLFITHGGINSAHEAMLRGVPMIVLPRTADQHIVARQLEAAGAGVVMERALATTDSLRTTAAHVLERPAYRLASSALGSTLREAGGALRAADCITAFKWKHGI